MARREPEGIPVPIQQNPDTREGERSTVPAFGDFERYFSAFTRRGGGRGTVVQTHFGLGKEGNYLTCGLFFVTSYLVKHSAAPCR